MQPAEVLQSRLKKIDGQDYGAYQSLKGQYQFENFILDICQIPKDPYAPPHTGIYRIIVDRGNGKVIQCLTKSRLQSIASRDYLARRFYKASSDIAKDNRGTGFSGTITNNKPGQAILDRNSVVLTDSQIEVRCFLGLPSGGRKVEAALAEIMLFDELPQIVSSSLYDQNGDKSQELLKHVQVAEDAETLRNKLKELGLVAFVANGSILPRLSGTSNLSMQRDSVIPFKSPTSLEISIKTPHSGIVTGMGIPCGVCLITGGGYHGKSTLLNSLEMGCYNHIPRDGREKCVSLSEAVKIRAYSGRSITCSDISPFIRDLPFEKDCTSFSTNNASGSTSQAASIVEAIESGAKVLLMDEDTCATNFMIRDAKMQQLVQKENEPITPFIDSVREMFTKKDISTILVLGGVGDYFDVSDQVIQMINYQPFDVTEKAHQISALSKEIRKSEGGLGSFELGIRIPKAESINPYNRYGKIGIYAKDIYRLNFGENTIDLFDLDQLVELSQTKALGFALDYCKKYMDGIRSLKEVIQLVMADIKTKGLDILSHRIAGHFAEFRPFELAFTLNRLRGIQITTENQK